MAAWDTPFVSALFIYNCWEIHNSTKVSLLNLLESLRNLHICVSEGGGTWTHRGGKTKEMQEWCLVTPFPCWAAEPIALVSEGAEAR